MTSQQNFLLACEKILSFEKIDNMIAKMDSTTKKGNAGEKEK